MRSFADYVCYHFAFETQNAICYSLHTLYLTQHAEFILCDICLQLDV